MGVGIRRVGQLGDNTVYLVKNSPIQIGSLTTWSNVGTGFEQVYAIKDA